MFERALAIISTGLAPRRKTLTSPESGRGWFPLIRESWSGAWQRNVTVDANAVEAHHAVYACKTLIAGDIAKLRIRLTKNVGNDVWEPMTDTNVTPLLRRPNHFQTWQQFIESWVLSKLGRGNTYVIMRRDTRRKVSALYVLDPNRVRTLVAPNGDVYYELSTDNVAGLEAASVTVPASEIIHDRAATLFHPLVGIPPLFASGLAAMQGLKIQENSAKFFANASQPGGVLMAPGRVDKANADELRQYWAENFTGAKAGNIAILGDGLRFEKLSMTAEEAELVNQQKLSAQIVCSTYKVPAFMVGMDVIPALGSVTALNQLYYGQCLQAHIEAIEACLDRGLELPANRAFEIDVEGLLRMDMGAKIVALAAAIGGTLMTPNEARGRINLKPVDGGDAVYAQQQDFSISALAERDRNSPLVNTGGGQP